MCKYVNDDIVGNSKMKRITVNEEDHLCFFATKPIKEGEELRYNYITKIKPGDDSELFWRKVRKMVSKMCSADLCLEVIIYV